MIYTFSQSLPEFSPVAYKVTYLITHSLLAFFPFPSHFPLPLSLLGITFWINYSHSHFCLRMFLGKSNKRQPLNFWMKATDILRKCQHKISANMFKKFTDNPKGIETSRFKEPFLLQVQESWDLNYLIKVTVEVFHWIVQLCWITSPPLCFTAEAAASLSQYLFLMCIKSNWKWGNCWLTLLHFKEKQMFLEGMVC